MSHILDEYALKNPIESVFDHRTNFDGSEKKKFFFNSLTVSGKQKNVGCIFMTQSSFLVLRCARKRMIVYNE